MHLAALPIGMHTIEDQQLVHKDATHLLLGGGVCLFQDAVLTQQLVLLLPFMYAFMPSVQ